MKNNLIIIIQNHLTKCEGTYFNVQILENIKVVVVILYIVPKSRFVPVNLNILFKDISKIIDDFFSILFENSININVLKFINHLQGK